MDEASDKPDKTPPRAKRRWYQFSLRAMFIWVTAIGLLLAVAMLWVAPAQRQRAAVKAVERLGGHVSYVDFSSRNENWITKKLRERLPRDFFDAVKAISFRNVSVQDGDLRLLADLPELRVLVLRGTRITGDALAHLRGMRNIQGLYIDSTQINDAGLGHLSELTQLQVLQLGDTQITDAGLAKIKGLSKLQSLSLYKTQISDAGLANLKELMQLRSLQLDDTKITDVGLANIRELTQLRDLSLRRTQISDEGLSQLRYLSQLELLSISGTRIINSSLAHLHGLTRLRGLEIRDTQISEEGISQFQTAMPECRVDRGSHWAP